MNVGSSATPSTLGVVMAARLSAAVLARRSEWMLSHRQCVAEQNLRPTRSSILAQDTPSTDDSHRSRTTIA
jgi:hypothetical protein